MLTSSSTGAAKTASRLYIPPDQTAPPIPCDECGFPSLHVGRLIGIDGNVLATVLVCTRCRAREQQH